jgi:DNA polymerase (family 10)
MQKAVITGMSNRDVSNYLKLTADLMDLHEENSFKVRAYQSAAFSIERMEATAFDLGESELQAVNGIGKSLAKELTQWFQSGTFSPYESLIAQTPAGVVTMLELKGLGPKKVKVLWKELQITGIDELLDACKSHKIASLKGFGPKTEEAILKAIEEKSAFSSWLHYADAEQLAKRLTVELNKTDFFDRIEPSGALRRKSEVMDALALQVLPSKSYSAPKLADFLKIHYQHEQSGPRNHRFNLSTGQQLELQISNASRWGSDACLNTGSEAHIYHALPSGSIRTKALSKAYEREEEVYAALGLPCFEPECREGFAEFEKHQKGTLDRSIAYGDLKGIIHNHSTYSDGADTVQAMAEACRALGMQYFGIADHSKSAFYARGLDENRVMQQWAEIDQLNTAYSGFKIFKGIESDILADGSLDYAEDMLKEFDYVVASIHSNLRMDIEKATARLIKAIENPYTTLLGHMTGRLLLRREGYPLHIDKVLDACVANGVIVELNADPWRLDIDWRYLGKVEQKGLMISINPDAHETAGLQNMVYGYYCAKKACFPKELVFNTKTLEEVAAYFKSRHGKS